MWQRIGISIGILMMTNVVVLGGVAVNRWGASAEFITLTERELPLSYGAFQDDENTGLALRIQWQNPHKRGQPLEDLDPGAAWFNQAKLVDVGFDCSVSLDDPEAPRLYGKVLPREAFVVLEYEGEAWATWQEEWKRDLERMDQRATEGTETKQRVARMREQYGQLPKTASRLMAIDIGRDLQLMRARYSDPRRYVIMKAQVRVAFIREERAASGEHRPARLQGYVTRLLIDELHVPTEWRAELAKMTQTNRVTTPSRTNSVVQPWQPRAPRYEVDLRMGARGEPWIVTIRPFQGDS